MIVIDPLPGAELIARKMVRRSSGVAPSYATLATTCQVIPAPVSVGSGAAAADWWVSTATVTNAFAAGEIDAVVKVDVFVGSWPDVSSVWVIPGGGWFVTVTVAVCVIATPSAVADTVLDSTTVELNAPEATPLAFVVPPPVRVFPDPVAARTTLDPLIGLPNASLTVTVIVEDPVPTTIEVGCALTVDCPASAVPAVTVTTGC